MRRRAIAVLLVSITRLAGAQRIAAGRAAPLTRQYSDSTGATALVASPTPVPVRFSASIRPYAPIVSAIVPGSGQLILGDDRFAAYAAVELLAWWKYLKDTREQAAQERSYKELARRVGRTNFSTTLPDGDWTYYESMRDRLESGVYSKNIGGPVEPETNTSTYNGYQWQLALRTNPNVASALAQYERLAIKPEYRWSWKNAQLQYDIFKRTTFKRDDAYYSAIQDLIVIGANHVISMVDAFATIRLQVRPDGTGRTQVGAQMHW